MSGGVAGACTGVSFAISIAVSSLIGKQRRNHSLILLEMQLAPIAVWSMLCGAVSNRPREKGEKGNVKTQPLCSGRSCGSVPL